MDQSTLSRCHSKMDCNIAFRFQNIRENEFLYIVYNFGDTRSRDLRVYTLVAIMQKSAYHAKYLRMSWTYLDLLYRFCGRIRGDDYPNIHFVFARGTLPWQPVKFGRCSQLTPGMTFTRCSGSRERIGRS